MHQKTEEPQLRGPVSAWTDQATEKDQSGPLIASFQRLEKDSPKSLQMVTAAMKLEDSCFLEEKLWPN